jgi:DNA-binding response OmpR family regulator
VTKILVVDDEAGIRFFVQETLERDDHQITAVESGEAALEQIRNDFDVALLDLMLPGIGGLQVLAEMRRRTPDTAVIVLTGHGSLETAVEALRQGAHDYLFKPVKPVELRESVRTALLKRRRSLRQRELLALTQQLLTNLEDARTPEGADSTRAPEPPPALLVAAVEPAENQERFVQRGGLIVDLMRHIVTLEERGLELSPTEFDLVAYLASEAPRVVSPQELVRAVQGYECETWEASETLRYHIHRIRQKVKAAGRADVIQTVRGVGYTLKL